MEPAERADARARPTVVAQAKLQRVSATARAANAAGEGDDGAGDEETRLRPPIQGAADARPAGSRRCRLARRAPPSRQRRTQARLAAASALVMPPLGRPQIRRQQTAAGARSRRDSSAAAGAGWMIQIGAPENLAKANALLSRARERNRSTLASAKPLTEKVRKGDATLYRARFAVLDSASAEAACRSLKRTGFSCFTAHD